MVEYDKRVIKAVYAIIGVIIFLVIAGPGILASIIGFIADNEKPEYVLTYYFNNDQSWKYTIGFYKSPEEDNTYQFLAKLTNTEPTKSRTIKVIFQTLDTSTVKTDNEIVLSERTETFIVQEERHKAVINDFLKRIFINGVNTITISSKDLSDEDKNIMYAITFGKLELL